MSALRFLTVLVLLGASGIVILQPTPAVAAPGDGLVTVRVVQEVNANGLVDDPSIEPPLAGVTVDLVDAAGTLVSAQTDSAGVVVFNPAVTALIGGLYRVVVHNPDVAVYHPGHIANGQSGAASAITSADLADSANRKLSGQAEWVDVTAGDVYLNTSFWFPGFYCQQNADVVGACMTSDVPQSPTTPTSRTLFTVPYQLTSTTPVSTLTEASQTGPLYGIAWDKRGERIFSSTVAHRGSEYGPGGAGAIYVTALDGATSIFATVPEAGITPHNITLNADYGFFDAVGKQSLGELEITFDGQYLLTVNLYSQEVYVYDATASTASAPIGVYSIPNPCAVPEDWRPFGLGVGKSTEYVGGVCSAQTTQNPDELRAYVYEFDAATGVFGPIILNDSLGYGRGRAYKGTTCQGGENGNGVEGRWWPWISDYPDGPNAQRPAGCGGGWIAYPQPILTDIVEDTNGDLIIGFRDRFGDQTDYQTINLRNNGTYGAIGEVGNGGDLLRACTLASGGFILDPNVTPGTDLATSSECTDNNVSGSNNGGQTHDYREYYIGDWRTGYHEEAFNPGIALSRVESTLLSFALDASGAVWTQGVAVIGRDGQTASDLGVRVDANTATFGEAGGGADLEVMCDLAPLQLGQRVWLDINGNGLQDADEPPIAGVTVRLLDAADTPVATTLTDSRGNALFDSSNVTGGLLPLTEYTITLDNAADHGASGALNGLVLTAAHSGTDALIDSDGVIPVGQDFPIAVVNTGDGGENDLAVGFGFAPDAEVSVLMFDTVGSVQNHADTWETAAGYTPDEARTITISARNDGAAPLFNVTVADALIAGAHPVQDLSCLFPGSSTPVNGSLVGNVWTVFWADTFHVPDGVSWLPGDTIVCTAVLELAGDTDPHRSEVTISTNISPNGSPGDPGTPNGPVITNTYHALTGLLQLAHAPAPVPFPTNAPQTVSWLITNGGETWLTNISTDTVTTIGSVIDSTSITCTIPGGGMADLTGGIIRESSGTPVLLAPGDEITCQALLSLTADEEHASVTTVTAQLVTPLSDVSGALIGGPLMVSGEPHLVAGGTLMPLVQSAAYAATGESAPPSPQLPDTGSSTIGVLALWTLGLLASGSLILWWRRRAA